MKNYIRYCTNYKCYDLAAFDVQWQVNLNMLNVFETKSIHLIVHKFNVFKTKRKVIQIFNVFETKVVVNVQLIFIYNTLIETDTIVNTISI